ncbi:hypothetical protein OHAE_3244 [Ochrobactrum soli]|uniref:Uncharacterized protein n=1 Tax=Ochrobactrum soli TaxID=2448455 RepID=A0A2P9HGU4_9HYPH|nr:hypothetical protein OHAE_3244 [[Ochrobactrum] soli]
MTRSWTCSHRDKKLKLISLKGRSLCISIFYLSYSALLFFRTPVLTPTSGPAFITRLQ